jgi:hypothetical protein
VIAALALGSLLALAPSHLAAGTSHAAVAPSGPQAITEPARPRLKLRTARGMTIAGGIATAALLGGGALAGAVLLDDANPERRAIGRVLPIPLVGPFLSVTRARAADRKVAPFVALGVEQAVAIAVLGVGATSLARHHRHERARGEAHRTGEQTAAGMLAGGVTMFALTYGLTLGFNIERARLGDPFARRLQIPLVGGFLAAAHAPSHVRGFGGLTSGTLQLGSVAVATIGAVVLARKSARRRQAAVLPSADATSVHVTAAWRF